jgi:hypothetical protein
MLERPAVCVNVGPIHCLTPLCLDDHVGGVTCHVYILTHNTESRRGRRRTVNLAPLPIRRVPGPCVVDRKPQIGPDRTGLVHGLAAVPVRPSRCHQHNLSTHTIITRATNKLAICNDAVSSWPANCKSMSGSDAPVLFLPTRRRVGVVRVS